MVVIYAAFLGSSSPPTCHHSRTYCTTGPRIPVLEQRLQKTRTQNIANERLIKELKTPAGIERAARELRDGQARREGLHHSLE